MSKSNIPPDVIRFAISYVDKLSKTPEDYEANLKKALENIHLYYEKVLPKLAEPGVSVEMVVEMLVESCLLEKNLGEGMEHFVRNLHSEGVEIEMDQMAFRRWVDKLSNLRLYRKIIHAMGLGSFEQELMEIEIRKAFEPGYNAPTTKKPEGRDGTGK